MKTREVGGEFIETDDGPAVESTAVKRLMLVYLRHLYCSAYCLFQRWQQYTVLSIPDVDLDLATLGKGEE